MLRTRRLLTALILCATLASPLSAAAQTAPILTTNDLGPGWTSQGATTKHVAQGDVYRDIFNAPADYPDGTGVALQVAVAASDEIRDALISQYADAYRDAGYDMQPESDVGDQPGLVGSLSTPDATSTLYLYAVGHNVVLLIAGTGQAQASGIDSLALQLAKNQAVRLS